ncbi:MAG TPA: peptidylprolyl isomerase [Candidatus Limnocylindria bacterium]|nr:peptidylprolyl isomerase [Candidatus Limnocylindria bacterium]
MASKGKRRRARPRTPEGQITRPVAAPVRRSRTRARPPATRKRSWLPLAIGAAVLLALGAAGAWALGLLPGVGPGAGGPSPSGPVAGSPPVVAPPDATPLANPPGAPAGDGTRATIQTELGEIVLELFTDSSPVAAQNFANLASAGYYDGIVFHRIVPGFVIQGGDPQGTGGGGPGYTIPDEAVVGEYERGIVAMARTPAPNSQGSQFFIVLDDSVRNQLPKSGGYAIFGRVLEGMDVVDQIADGPAGGLNGDTALEPVTMTQVTVERP